MKENVPIPRVVVSPLGISYIYRRNPWVGVWWSIILPGFGHITLGHSLKGLLLMSWEILVNQKAHINMAIYFTFLGRIDEAKAVIDYQWAMIYPLFYVFAMYDSYRLGLEYNHFADLESLQPNRRFDQVSVSLLAIHGLDRRSPGMAAVWSAAMAGLGHLYCNRTLKAVILMGWYLAVSLKSGLSLATYHTVLGHWELAKQGLDYQWLLFWPSIFVFSITDAYADVVEQNNMADMAFRYRIQKYLKNEQKRRGAKSWI